LLGVLPLPAQNRNELKVNGPYFSSNNSVKQTQAGSAAGTADENKVPTGTILPVVLRTTFSFEKCKPDQTLRGQIAQDVPLANGSTIRKGSLIEGHIVEVTPAASGNGAKVSIRFDKLYLAGHWVPLVTNLRAIAGL
jgi:hypothetical protein